MFFFGTYLYVESLNLFCVSKVNDLVWSCNLRQNSNVNFPVDKVFDVASIRNMFQFGARGDMFGTPTKLLRSE